MIKTKRSIQWVKEKNKSAYSGIHLIAEFWGGKIIDDSKKIKKILFEAVKRANNTPLDIVIHKFQPQGLTGVVLLAESHIAIHTWPEFNYVALDIYTCGDKANPYKSLEYLKEEFQPLKSELKKIKRGSFCKI
ncbi:MAG: adenosylmethionine decarboxylase [Candidatus Pacebacteria bacterium]|nr:adenosylmethionine decarboxylase [Candidatus Paceibacterota bacterium]